MKYLKPKMVKRLISNKYFNLFVMIVIIINSIAIIVISDHDSNSHNFRIINTINGISLIIFIIELLLRLQVSRSKFLKNGWYIYEAIVILIAILAYIPMFEFLTVFRVLMLLRLCEFMPALQILVHSLVESIQGIIATMVLITIIYSIYASLGTQFFAKHSPQFFGSFSQSFKTLFQVMVFDNMGNVLDNLLQYSHWYWVYILSFVFFTSFTFLNLMMSVIINSMDRVTNSSYQQQTLDHHSSVKDEIKNIRAHLHHIKEMKDEDQIF